MEGMEAHEHAEKIRESLEEHGSEGHHGVAAANSAENAFRNRAAITIAVLAMLLAITSISGSGASREVVTNNILASDTWAFYQAKNIRQTSNQLAADQLQLQITTGGASWPPAAKDTAQKQVTKYLETVARYETDPVAGEGKKELTEKAQSYEEKRDHAERQIPNFEFAQGFFQIAIVLSSAALVLNRKAILYLAIALGVLATVLMLNGFFLAVHVPLVG